MTEKRYEFKYILNIPDALRAENMVSQWMYKDKYFRNTGYKVTSIYFDTYSHKDYYDKSGGFLARKKLRARIYGTPEASTDNGIWLEIKKKHDMKFEKERVQISVDDWEDIRTGHYTAVLNRSQNEHSGKTIKNFIWFCLSEGRKPSYFVQYDRSAYVLPWEDRLRVTFDKNIETSEHGTFEEPPFLFPVTSDEVIMEVKFSTRLPWFLSAIIRQLNLRRTSNSKYANSVDAIHYANPMPR